MKALVFAHFDKHGLVDDFVLHSLRCLRPYFDVICFSSTAQLSAQQRARAALYCDIVVARPNRGYDFFSWRVGFEALSNIRYTEIAFANDSCYGPITDLADFFHTARASDADLWGATLNRQMRPHVQSFFMNFGPRLVQSGFARTFWRSLEIEPDKMQLILKYEVGLSALVEEQGFRIGAAVDLGAISDAMRQAVLLDNAPEGGFEAGSATAALIASDDCPNPCQLYWGETLRRGSPFLKIEVLRDNPLGANLGRIRSVVRESKFYDIGLIDRHIERVSPKSRWKNEII